MELAWNREEIQQQNTIYLDSIKKIDLTVHASKS